MADANTHARDSAGATDKRKHPAHWFDSLSDRSKLFYDGTYKWDGTDGFWDDTDIHHDFSDPNDPEAYPPTPRPVGSWLEDGEDGRVVEDEFDDLPEAALQESAQMQPNSVHMGFLARFTQESSKTVLINGNVSKQRLLRDGLFVGQLNRERLLGQVEGMLVGQQVLVDGHSLIDSYKLCGMEVPSALLAEVDGGAFDPAQDIAEPSSMSGDGADISSVGRDVNQLDVSNEDVQIKSEGGRAADAKEGDFARELSLGSSPLSECPSDLSDWEMNDQINPFDRAQTPKLDLKSESNSPSHESLTDGLERPNKTSSRSDSTDSAIEITATRRSTRIFLIK